jgi:hypothetical protein
MFSQPLRLLAMISTFTLTAYRQAIAISLFW